ncbi:hypothetical protein [Ralstonia pseudosolanacearum]|uniref:hypothetical protein n=1 Tax=Ralstonia pseudosolanacearum TaxID=1310165 RepID=UPI001E34631D|nr:hypothetical protein [Ralstonia pseudosolanacearum]UWD92751.1 hypothetical protein NY025_19085 [Ralstonia pseudosolanacearum]
MVQHLAPDFQAHLAAKVYVQDGAQVQGHENPFDQGEFLAALGRSAMGATIARGPAFYPVQGGAALIQGNPLQVDYFVEILLRFCQQKIKGKKAPQM